MSGARPRTGRKRTCPARTKWPAWTRRRSRAARSGRRAARRRSPRSARSEEHTSELQSHRDLHSFPTRRSSDLTDVPGAYQVARVDEAALARGEIWPQSRASQVAALCVGSHEGERVLDLCAAPGGKTAMLAGEVVAVDVNES